METNTKKEKKTTTGTKTTTKKAATTKAASKTTTKKAATTKAAPKTTTKKAATTKVAPKTTTKKAATTKVAPKATAKKVTKSTTSKKANNSVDIKFMNRRIDNLGLFLQLVLSAAVIISLITSIFVGPLLMVTYALMSLILFVLSYNNYIMYERKYLTVLYFIFGVILTIETIAGVIVGL